jgi:ATP-dependent Clp protease ATP-binding subunit ClpX
VVPLELTHSTYGDHIVLSTQDIAFIAAGAFSGFQQVARRRAADGTIGFGREGGPGQRHDTIAVDFSHADVESVANFQAYGFLPELIARFTRAVPFQPLDTDTLKDILVTSVVSRMRREFTDEGLVLDVEDAVLDHVVHDALARETGARGLASTLTRHLERAAFEAFGDEGEQGTVTVRLVNGTIDVSLDTRKLRRRRKTPTRKRA